MSDLRTARIEKAKREIEVAALLLMRLEGVAAFKIPIGGGLYVVAGSERDIKEMVSRE